MSSCCHRVIAAAKRPPDLAGRGAAGELPPRSRSRNVGLLLLAGMLSRDGAVASPVHNHVVPVRQHTVSSTRHGAMASSLRTFLFEEKK